MNAQPGKTDFSKRSIGDVAGINVVFRPGLPLLCCILSLMMWGMMVFNGYALGPSHISEPSVSLQTHNEPLGQVLDQITQKTAYRFSLEDTWRDHPVSVAFRNLPLSQGLKRILSSFNHAVVYESQYDIRIVIFGEVVFQPAGSSPTPRPVQVPYQEEEEQEPPDLEPPEPLVERIPPGEEQQPPSESDDAEPADEDEANDEP